MLRTRCVPAETPCGLFRPNLALDSLEFLSDVTSEPPRLLQIEVCQPKLTAISGVTARSPGR